MPVMLPIVELQNAYILFNTTQNLVTTSSSALSFTVIHNRLSTLWTKFDDLLKQPTVYKPLLAFSISLVVIYILLSCLGFAPQGILAGSLAAGFQAWMYGGFTPASGIFATLTSVGMLGVAQPVFALIALVMASAIAGVVTICMR